MTVSPSQEPRFSFAPGIWLATALINGYQRFISPHKGFCCAHRVLHGSRSCSGYAKFVIQQRGVIGALPSIRQRLADCSIAAAQIHHQRDEEDGKNRRSRCQGNWDPGNCHCSPSDPAHGCSGVDCNLLALDCTPELDCNPDLGCGDCGDYGSCEGADCGDCGSVDCLSGLDCSGC